MKTFIVNFLNDERGASAAEYALILAIVGTAIGGAALALGQQVETAIGGAAQEVKDCNEGDATCTYTLT